MINRRLDMSERKKILELRKLKKYFPVGRNKQLKAVEDVSFVVYEGEKFGIVGESGCGKSTLGRTILQLYPQTSGSCVYYGKSIQELNPKYIQENINNLKNQQQKAGEYYQKSLELDKKIEELKKKQSAFDAEGSAKDAKEYDKLEKEIAKLEFDSKECRKDASRQLREGSRTVGSLILCKDIDKVAELFTKAENEVRQAHESLKKYFDAKDIYDRNLADIDDIDHVDERIAALQAVSERNEAQEGRLRDLLQKKKDISSLNRADIVKKNEALLEEMKKYQAEADKHHEIEMGYRHEAFDKYRGKDILPLTERTLDKAYQDKLDGNYETGINLSKLTAEEMRSLRPDMQMVFQDPAASLDPRETIGKAIEEPFRIHTKLSAESRKQRALELLNEVDLKPEHYYAYPNSLSGGMKQRAGIARAIALNPSLIILDEAVSALDVSVQAQILQLLNQLRDDKDLTYLFITHDLGVVKHFCDRVLVMYLGNVCELADAKELFAKPLHPYTQSLLSAVPHLDPDRRDKEENVLQGEVPSPINPPSGCPFHTRCKQCMDICSKEKPKYFEISDGHYIACHLYDKKGEER